MRKKIGRPTCQVVELLLDFCQLRYGTTNGSGTCPAVLGVDSPQKCLNTRKTCPVPDSYLPAAKSYRFSNTAIKAPDTAKPTLVSVSFAPAKLDPGNSMGYRDTLKVVIQDTPGTDTDNDPYFRERSYTPAKQGTYWGKLLARNPYYQNRLIKVYSGYLNSDGSFDAANFDVRTYVITRITGPDSGNFQVTVEAQDALSMAVNLKAQAPLPCNGTLTADITDSSLSLTLDPPGVGDLQYSLSGTICIGNECMTYTRTSGSDTFVITNRGTDHTGPDPFILLGVSHSKGDVAQECLRYSHTFVTDVLYDLLVTYGNVPTSFIDKPQWDDEATIWLSQHFLTALIVKPTGVTTLVNELVQQCLFYIWSDVRAALIPFRAVRPAIRNESITLGEQHNILQDSASVSEDPSLRISQVITYYRQFNPTLAIDREDNYPGKGLAIDPEAQTAAEYGTKQVKKIYSRWFNSDNDTQVSTLGNRLLAKYRNNPKTLAFSLDAKDSEVWLASYINIVTSVMQDEFGDSPSQRMEIIQVAESIQGTKFDYLAMDTFFNRRYAFISPTLEGGSPFPDYVPASQADKDRYAFICQDDGLMTNGDEGYAIV